ncbi:MAG TPA: hypothetical protein VJS64_00860 [Pyrinomonadaceae bacterium]|nr:hypothetical protein [Pyrinomonadaceae bacterium]
MITGFNTDIEHDGVVYHVQTEDKGLETPLILSLVYSGGAILASKRARYEDLIASGFSDEALAERLTRQHKLICAAIHAGRIEDLKRMSAGPATEVTKPAAETPTAETEEPEPQLEILRGHEQLEVFLAYEAEKTRLAALEAQAAADTVVEGSADLTIEEKTSLPSLDDTLVETAPLDSLYSVHDRRQSVMGELPMSSDGLRITLLGKHDFRSGESLSIKVMVGLRTGSQEKPVAKAAVSVKILGTTFRPQIYTAKTHADGVAAIATKIPTFSSGRAAILIRAVFEGKETELRRVILPS